MRAWLIDDLTGIGSLRLAEIPDPVPHEGEVILRVHYASLNPADRYLAEGQYPAKPPFPHVLGRDGMGTVEQVGPGVTLLRPGDRAGRTAQRSGREPSWHVCRTSRRTRRQSG